MSDVEGLRTAVSGVAVTSEPDRSTGRPRVDIVLSRIGAVLQVLNARFHLRSATSVGKRVRLKGRPAVRNDGRMIIGDRVRLDSSIATLELVTLRHGFLEIGDNTFINHGTSIASSAHVKIGKGCLIGADVMMMDCDFHRVEDKSWDTTGEEIVIEDHVWLGNRSMVLKGVRVGHDAVVAAGSVVTHDVEPRTLVAGIPARTIRRF